MKGLHILLLLIGWAALPAAVAPARAQMEFPPPQGKGRVVVVVSGHSGPGRYQTVSALIAQLGYDVVLFDANSLAGARHLRLDVSSELRAAIQQAQQMPHAIAGKVGLVGFSQGGGQVLIHGAQMADLAAVVVAWYPLTRSISDIPDFVGRLQIPVLVLAGEADTYHDCCLIGTARALATAAGGRIELVTYPNVVHDFVYGGAHYDPQAYADAFQRTAATLARYLGR
jgi:dienelactone hydrolase